VCSWLLSKLRIGSREHLILDKVGRHLPRSLAALRIATPGEEVLFMWAFSNLAASSTKKRDAVLKNGVLPPLLRLCKPNAPIAQQRTLAWMLINMCASVALTSVEQAAETERWDHSSCWLQYSLRELFMCPAQRHASA